MIRPHTIVIPAACFASLILGLTAFFASSQLTTTLPQPFLAAVGTPSFHKEKQADVAVQDSDTANPNGERTCTPGSAYPEQMTHWCDLIQKTANEAGLAVSLVAAVIYQESGGDPLAYSASGAVGLMQVMPRDGLAAGFQCINGPCFSSRPTMQELQDPEFNLSYGARLLKALIAREGSVRDALKAYGPLDVGYRYADTVLAIQERYQ